MQIADTATRIFSDHVDKATLDAAEAGEFPEALWAIVQETGLHLVGTEGSGTTLVDLYGLLKIAGRFAVPLPLTEILVANHLGSRKGDHGFPVASAGGFITFTLGYPAPWGRRAEKIVLNDMEYATEFEFEPGTNVAGEARDRCHPHAKKRHHLLDEVATYLALGRAAMSTGALERVLEMSLNYAQERQQFGRPISKFQAIQHALARMAGEVAAASCACDLAMEGLKMTDMYSNKMRVAVAKSRVDEAAGKVAEVAHQVHGAMGFTHEHTLHYYTRRLWAWRDEHGKEGSWWSYLGDEIAQGGADKAWEFITNWS